jgi:histidine triad (HIT) family protein
LEECPFCRIVARELPAHILDEDEQVIVFLSLENHPLVVPKEHVRDIYELPASLGAAVMAAAIRAAKAVKQALQCDGVYLTQANEPAAGQDVFHFHLHVYPVWQGSAGALHAFAAGLSDWSASDEERAARAALLRRALGGS